MERIRVRQANIEDVRGISRLMVLNGLPRAAAGKEAFLVAESGDEILAALEYRFGKGRLLLGDLISDPVVGERHLAEALYREARVFARRSGLAEVRSSGGRAEYMRSAGYRRRGRGWTSRTEQSGHSAADGWRRVLALWGRVPVPFFREVGR